MTDNRDRTAKPATEMTFNEFRAWATGYVLFGIGEGTALQTLMHTVVDQASRNIHFGRGTKPL